MPRLSLDIQEVPAQGLVSTARGVDFPARRTVFGRAGSQPFFFDNSFFSSFSIVRRCNDTANFFSISDKS
jgi:hypothetical protein